MTGRRRIVFDPSLVAGLTQLVSAVRIDRLWRYDTGRPEASAGCRAECPPKRRKAKRNVRRPPRGRATIVRASSAWAAMVFAIPLMVPPGHEEHHSVRRSAGRFR
jgi:hypothetical protein